VRLDLDLIRSFAEPPRAGASQILPLFLLPPTAPIKSGVGMGGWCVL
jgi:hypothetical protein